MKKEILVAAEDFKELERLHYEYNSLRDTISYLLSQHREEADFVTQDYFKNYQKSVVEKFKEYSEFKAVITKKYVPEEYQTPNHRWDADFEKKLIVVSW